MKFKYVNYRIACLLVCIFVSAPCLAQDQTKFILTLNDSLVNNMKSLGSLNSVVQEDARGKVSSVEVKFDTVDASVAPVDANSPVSITGQACIILLSDDLIEKARNAPLRFPVPAGASFAKVFLNYPAARNGGSGNRNNLEAPSPADDEVAITAPAAPAAPQHFVILSERQMLDGQIDITEKLKFNTRFGEVEIGIDQIKGIRFHIDSDDAAVIVLNNGDTVTGVPVLDSLNLQTDWGRAEFDPTHVESLVTSRNARFRPNQNSTGPRWMLIE